LLSSGLLRFARYDEKKGGPHAGVALFCAEVNSAMSFI